MKLSLKVAVAAAVVLAATGFVLFDTIAQTDADPGVPIVSPSQLGPQLAQAGRPAPTPAPAPAPAPAPSTPQRTEQTVQDGWVITCVEMSGQTKKTCSAQMQVKESQQRRTIFVWIIGRTAEGTLTSVFQGPTGVQIPKGIEIKLGSAAPRKANYVICTAQSCEASIAMDEAMVKEAIAAVNANAVAVLTVADGRTVQIPMPLKGIDKVIAAVRR